MTYNIHQRDHLSFLLEDFLNLLIWYDFLLQLRHILNKRWSLLVYYSILFIQMHQTFYFLIIGRSGSGKSATTRFLTGDRNIKVMNSPNEVTKTVKFYRSTKQQIETTKIEICVLDIPGLDELNNRKIIRQLILRELENRKIELDGILYTIDSVARDTVNNKKIFNFINDLPWSYRDIKDHLYPIFTKYDNLIFDGDDENTKQTFQQFSKIFEANHYGDSWKYNHQYWINETKNLQFKMNVFNEIKQTYETQLQKLINLVRKSKSKLNYQKIQVFLKEESKYIERKIKNIFKIKETPLRNIRCSLNPSITVEIWPKKNIENYTAGTLTGLGIILSKSNTSDLLKAVGFIGSGIAGIILAKNLLKQSTHMLGSKHEQKAVLALKHQRNYIVQKINEILTLKLKQYEQQIKYEIIDNKIIIKLPNKFEYDCFLVNKDEIHCYIEDQKLEKLKNQTFEYQFDEVDAKIITTFSIRLDIMITIPDETVLLQSFEADSFNFKKEFDNKFI